VNSSNSQNRGFQYAQPLRTGGNMSFGFTSTKRTTNNINDTFIPSLSGGLSMNISQPLLSGFGVGLNTRQLVIARNNQRNADNSFKQQVNTMVNQVVQAYWNLVSSTLNVGVSRQSLDLSNRLLDQNKKQVEIGTMAPVDIYQTEVQVANGESSLIQAEASVQTQENTLKNLISRNGIASPQLASVRIIPTSRAEVPDVEPVRPIQDLIESALSNRPELAQQRITMDNNRINLKAAKNSLLPQLNATFSMSNPAQSGVLNPFEYNYITGENTLRDTSRLNPDYFGGFSNVLRQLFTVPTLTYSLGFTLNINIRNRTAQATYVQQELQLRQTELNLQQQMNTIRTDVANAQINIETARSRYAAAVKAESAQEKTLDATERRFQLGASTLFEVITQQNNLASQRQNLVTARVAYANARLALDAATGTLLDKYNVAYEEAKDGQLARRPDPIPDVVNPPNAANRLLQTAPAVATPR
jgi:outer membrane protein TolC